MTGQKLWTVGVSDGRPSIGTFMATAAPSTDSDAAENLCLWLGMRDGQLWQVQAGRIVVKRPNVHLTPVRIVHFVGDGTAWTLSADGKLAVWSSMDLKSMPHTFRVTPNFSCATVAGNTLWVGRNKQIMVYNPSAARDRGLFLLTPRPLSPMTNTPNGQLSELTSGAHLATVPDLVFFGHDDGSVTIFSISSLTAVENINVSIYGVSAMHGVGATLWVGLKNGNIQVCDVSMRPWIIRKDWKAHAGPITHIISPPAEGVDSCLPVASWTTAEHAVSLWDGSLKNDCIERQMHSRSAEFCNFSHITAQVVTWNAGAVRPEQLTRDPTDSKFVQNVLLAASSPADVIIFGFQELVELDNKSVTAKSMFKSKKRDQEVPVEVKSAISQAYKQWQDYLESEIACHTSDSHKLVHSSNLVGLFTAIFVRKSLVPRIRSIRFSQVKTGLGGFHGNKGGLVVRLLLDDSSLCFVNCHLAAGQSGSAQRNKDIGAILDTQFLDESHNSDYVGKGIFVNGGDGTRILDHELCFFSGDMNYRINMHRQLAVRAIEDGNWSKLLACDQLSLQLRKNASLRLRAFEEPPIAFAPTYKFDIGTDNYDSSEKKRVPAWCDRIFYRGGSYIRPLKYTSLVVRASDHRPVSAIFDVQLRTIDAGRRMAVYKECVDNWLPRDARWL
jgi:endonuclease/exonuclease/phosphatase family metal-dependent hydrolase